MGNKASLSEQFEIANVAMATKDTEYSYTIPNGTEKITLKLRNPGAILRLYDSTGATPYITVPQSSSYTIENVKFRGKTIYLQSDTNTMVCEIIVLQ